MGGGAGRWLINKSGWPYIPQKWQSGWQQIYGGNKKITDPAALFFLARKRKPPFHQVSVESTPLTASHRFGPFRRFGNSP